MTPRRKKQMVKRRQPKPAPKRKESRLDYETRLKNELGLQFVGYLKMPINYFSLKDFTARSTYFGDWNPDMPELGSEPRVYHITLHLAPVRYAGGATKNGFSGGNVTKKLTCYPHELRSETKKLLQIVQLEHEVEINGLASYAVIRS